MVNDSPSQAVRDHIPQLLPAFSGESLTLLFPPDFDWVPGQSRSPSHPLLVLLTSLLSPSAPGMFRTQGTPHSQPLGCPQVCSGDSTSCSFYKGKHHLAVNELHCRQSLGSAQLAIRQPRAVPNPEPPHLTGAAIHETKLTTLIIFLVSNFGLTLSPVTQPIICPGIAISPTCSVIPRVGPFIPFPHLAPAGLPPAPWNFPRVFQH